MSESEINPDSPIHDASDDRIRDFCIQVQDETGCRVSLVDEALGDDLCWFAVETPLDTLGSGERRPRIERVVLA